MPLSFLYSRVAFGVITSTALGLTASPASALLCGGVPPAVHVEHEERLRSAPMEWQIVLGRFGADVSDASSWGTEDILLVPTDSDAAIVIGQVIWRDLHLEGFVIDGGSVPQLFTGPVSVELTFYFNQEFSNAFEGQFPDLGSVPWLMEETLFFLHRPVKQDQWRMEKHVSGCSGPHIPNPGPELLEEVSACMAIPGPDCWIDWIYGEREFVWR